MKASLKVIAVVSVMLVGTVPAIAEVAGAEKPLSILQFSELSESRGLSGRVLDGRYQEYRQGRVPRTTLSTANVR